MKNEPNTLVRMFGRLHTLRKDQGLDPKTEVFLPSEGRTALEIAKQLDLPTDMIEGVFINRFFHPVDVLIRPGDRVAFVPSGVPAPHCYSGVAHSIFRGEVKPAGDR